MLQVDIEDAFEQRGPAQVTEVRGRGCLGLMRSGRVRLGAGARDNRRSQFRIGCEHAMKSDEMQRRTVDERGEALQELQRFHDDMRGAISVRCLKPEHHLPGTVECQALVGKGGPGDVPTKVFELMTLVDGEPHFGMQAKALLVDIAFRGRRRRLAGERL